MKGVVSVVFFVNYMFCGDIAMKVDCEPCIGSRRQAALNTVRRKSRGKNIIDCSSILDAC